MYCGNLLLDDINTLYRDAELRLGDTVNLLRRLGCPMHFGWENGHYRRDDAGDWQRESFPIPVIHIEGLCDVELPFDALSVSTRLSRASAVDYRYDKFNGYDYEILGADDYLTEYYRHGISGEERRRRLSASREREVSFFFHFAPDTTEDLLRLIGMLLQDGFHD